MPREKACFYGMMARMAVLFVSLCGMVSAGQSFDTPVIRPEPSFVAGIKQPVISLNGQWDISLDAEKWEPVTVPGEPAMQGFAVTYDEPFEYRKRFTVPADFKDAGVFLRFHGVYGHAKVYVNGTFVRFAATADDDAPTGKVDAEDDRDSITVKAAGNTVVFDKETGFAKSVTIAGKEQLAAPLSPILISTIPRKGEAKTFSALSEWTATGVTLETRGGVQVVATKGAFKNGPGMEIRNVLRADGIDFRLLGKDGRLPSSKDFLSTKMDIETFSAISGTTEAKLSVVRNATARTHCRMTVPERGKPVLLALNLIHYGQLGKPWGNYCEPSHKMGRPFEGALSLRFAQP